ncbi:MAG: tRNA1(Val) (adenine(37)-N6)-methyltransferase, partial [Weeksellaceae bacterium]
MSIFKFKQFNVEQKLSAAKVGTDGVLLGAWVNLDPTPSKILDIGTGTGLIALMLAQRSPLSYITALDIDKDAIVEASLNFENSPWPDRLNAVHTSLQAYNTEEKFDLIISNPP